MNQKIKTKNVATVRVKTDLEKPIDVDLLAESIKAVSDNLEKAVRGPLKIRTVVILVHHQMPASQRISIADIETVLKYLPEIKWHLTK